MCTARSAATVPTSDAERLAAVISYCKEKGPWADLEALVVRALAEGKSIEQMQAEWEVEDENSVS